MKIGLEWHRSELKELIAFKIWFNNNDDNIISSDQIDNYLEQKEGK